MPNWCDCTYKCVGDLKDVRSLYKALKFYVCQYTSMAHLRVTMERPPPLLQLRFQRAGLLQKLFRCDIHTHPFLCF